MSIKWSSLETCEEFICNLGLWIFFSTKNTMKRCMGRGSNNFVYCPINNKKHQPTNSKQESKQMWIPCYSHRNNWVNKENTRQRTKYQLQIFAELYWNQTATYFIWNSLFVPRWSKSWHRHPTNKARHSMELSCSLIFPVYEKTYILPYKLYIIS